MAGNQSSKWGITQSTPISIALVLALCGGAYWTGSVTTHLQLRVDINHDEIVRVKALAKEVAELSKRNQHLIEMNEHRIQGLESQAK